MTIGVVQLMFSYVCICMCVSPEEKLLRVGCRPTVALCAEAICCTCFLSLVSVSSAPAEDVTVYISHGWVALLLLYFTKFMCVNESSRF